MGWEIYDTLPNPNPDLTPLEVVKIQLDALQNNDLLPNNKGIRIAFKHTSPLHRKAIGTLDRFAELLMTQVYRAIIGFERAELDPMIVAGINARQTVYLVHKEDVVSYLFILSQQRHEPFTNCWMTDAILTGAESD